MHQITNEFYRSTRDLAMRIDRKSLVRFHTGLRDPSLWMVSPRSLFHQEPSGSPGNLTEFGKQIGYLISIAAFSRIKYGTNDRDVLHTLAKLRPASGARKRLFWQKTPTFTALETTHHSVNEDFLPPCHEMLARCIGQELPHLWSKESCLVLISNTIMEDLFNEQGGQPKHYAYNFVITFRPSFTLEDPFCDDDEVDVYV